MNNATIIMPVKIALCLLLACSLLYANGGPIDWSNFKCVGTVSLMKENCVALEKEVLTIVIKGDYSDVHADYTLVKTKDGKSRQNIAYGFPVDYMNWYSENAKETDNDSSVIKEFSMVCNGCTLAVESRHEREKMKKRWSDDKERVISWRTWFVASLPISATDTFTLSIHYIVRNALLDEEYSDNPFTEFSGRTFCYDLQPAKTWKTGKIKDLQITVDARDIIKHRGTIDPGKFGFKQTEPGMYSFTKNHYTITSKSSFTISYQDTLWLLSNLLLKGRASADSIIVRASSSLGENYKPQNLVDGSSLTAWFEGESGNGIGSWVEFTFKQPRWVSVVGLMNGYWKSKELCLQNARPKKIAVEVYRDTAYDSTKVCLKKFVDTVTIPESFGYRDASDTTFFNDVFFFGTYYHDLQAQELFLTGKTKRIKITILDVWPGTKYKDMGISEIYFH